MLGKILAKTVKENSESIAIVYGNLKMSYVPRQVQVAPKKGG
jgi:hypothetical protein